MEATPTDPADAVRGARRTPEHWVLLGTALLGLAALVVLGLFVDPDPRGYGTHEKLGLRPCMPMELWNVPCPGCGVTTSVTHAASGDLLGSLRVQPFGFALVLTLLCFAGWAVIGHFRGRDLWDGLGQVRWSRWASIGGVLMAAAWMYKIAAVRGWF